MEHPLLNIKGHFALGLLTASAGLLLVSVSEYEDLGGVIVVLGMLYLVASFFLIAIAFPIFLIVKYKFEDMGFRIGLPRFLVNNLAKRAVRNATDQILRYKQLHEAGVLTDDEYELKTAPLKKTILREMPQ